MEGKEGEKVRPLGVQRLNTITAVGCGDNIRGTRFDFRSFVRLPATVLVPHSDWNSMVSGELHPMVRYCLPGGLHGIDGLSWLFSLPGRLAASALPTSSAFSPPLIS